MTVRERDLCEVVGVETECAVVQPVVSVVLVTCNTLHKYNQLVLNSVHQMLFIILSEHTNGQ